MRAEAHLQAGRVNEPGGPRAPRRGVDARDLEGREEIIAGNPGNRLENRSVTTTAFREGQKVNKAQRAIRIPVFVHGGPILLHHAGLDGNGRLIEWTLSVNPQVSRN